MAFMLVSGLIGVLAVMLIAWLAISRPNGVGTTADGWNELRPGFTNHLSVLGCCAFVAIIIYFFATGGSSRLDADEQNVWALLIGIAFGGGGAWLFWLAYLTRFQWKDGHIRICAPFRHNRYYRFSDIRSVAEGYEGSELKLRMADGRTIRINTYACGYVEFVHEIARAAKFFSWDTEFY